jgi:tRNA (guanine-N7-)-methyltransferase
MIHLVRIWVDGRERPLVELAAALARRPPGGRLELEIGFGKGRFLLAQAAARPETTFLGIETALPYWRIANQRAARRGLRNLVTVCGDALYVLATCLAPGSVDAVHVYFPDPWPKLRHRRRRLLDAATVDLVLGVLVPGGVLSFATDHVQYGEAVEAVLRGHPQARVRRVEGPWPGGARTNYEVKYEREGRAILRLEATRLEPGGAAVLHPDGRVAVVAGDAPAAEGGGREGDDLRPHARRDESEATASRGGGADGEQEAAVE